MVTENIGRELAQRTRQENYHRDHSLQKMVRENSVTRNCYVFISDYILYFIILIKILIIWNSDPSNYVVSVPSQKIIIK